MTSSPPNSGEATPLTEPRDGVPAVTQTSSSLATYLAALARGTGPVAVDAERASGFRYGQQAYLVQIRRAGAGTALVDPRALPDLSGVTEIIGGEEWVLHAADQDLPSLAEVGMKPNHIFDTELAGRLLNKHRVGLATLVTTELGYALAKEHSAADWSRRPLPDNWLRYAALDVEVLIELRHVMAEQLHAAGKYEWALEEFDALLTAEPPTPRPEPWRRTSGSHVLKDRRQLAIVRSLWLARDKAAQQADIAPGRVLPDAAIVAAAESGTPTLTKLKQFQSRSGKRRLNIWQAAVAEALALPESELPTRRAPLQHSFPQPRSWRDRAPEAAARLEAVKRLVRVRATELDLPQENLLTPDYQRRISWAPPQVRSPGSIAQSLASYGARQWQIHQLAESLVDALDRPEHILETLPDSNGEPE